MMSNDSIPDVPTFRSCVQSQRFGGTKQNLTKLFPPSELLYDISINQLEPLAKTNNGNQFINVFNNPYSIHTKSMPMQKTTTPFPAAETLNNWILLYRIPHSILFDNGLQFLSDFWKTKIHILDINLKSTPATTHIQMDKQTITARCIVGQEPHPST